MRSLVFIALTSLIALAACSKPAPQREETTQGESKFGIAPMRDSEAPTVRRGQEAGPDIGITAAPGVAFNYRYAFRLPNAKIGAVQEEHAMACEKLGTDRCRIVGMRYRLSGDDNVSAMLAFKLDPAIAREFGKQGIAAVSRAEGKLIDSEISGTDAGGAIAQEESRSIRLREDLARAEATLKGLAAKSNARDDVQAQINGLRQQLRGSADTKAEARASLATTPMVFDYGSSNLVPAFDGQSPLRDAIGTAVSSFAVMLSFIIIAFGGLLPWALLAGAAYAVFRAVRRRWPRTKGAPGAAPLA